MTWCVRVSGLFPPPPPLFIVWLCTLTIRNYSCSIKGELCSYIMLSERQSTSPGRSCVMLSQSVYQSLSLRQYQWGVWVALASWPSIWFPRIPGTENSLGCVKYATDVGYPITNECLPITIGDITLHSVDARLQPRHAISPKRTMWVPSILVKSLPCMSADFNTSRVVCAFCGSKFKLNSPLPAFHADTLYIPFTWHYHSSIVAVLLVRLSAVKFL